MPHFTETLILSFQIFDNTHVITRKYRSLDAAEYFLHKSFIFAAREVLDVFSMRMSKYQHIVLKILPIFTDLHLIEGPIISNDTIKIRNGAEITYRMSSFQCLVLVFYSSKEEEVLGINENKYTNKSAYIIF